MIGVDGCKSGWIAVVLSDRDLPRADKAAVDDMLDAAVAAWTARRIAGGTALRVPQTTTAAAWERSGPKA